MIKRKVLVVVAFFMLAVVSAFFIIQANAKGLHLSKTNVVMHVGESVKLKVSANCNVRWSSSDKKVATVTKKGRIRAKASGSAVIKAKYGKKILKCKVTVKRKDNTGDGIMKIKVTDGDNTIIYRLNDTAPAKSLYSMLPMDVEIENYGSNEKIFYPKKDIATKGGQEGSGKAGDLALFSPWGNVVMYYGDFSSYPGLYLLGSAESGSNNVKKLSGKVHIEVSE